MEDAGPAPRRIHILRESVARKIAAGEVIDRPFSVVRELLDNSIDAGADHIDVYLQSGGLESVRVVDNGAGMSREDLELCWQPHATSKIESDTDLEQVRSLGFRGEALSSMAAVSRLEISSTLPNADTGYTLRVAAGRKEALEPSRPRPGTTAEVRDLFYTMPARKRFLKRPAGETAMGRTVFTEKALPFPERTFRLFTDGELKLFFPPSDLSERVATAFSKQVHPDFLHTVDASGESFTARIVLGGPELSRKDRKLIQIYVNNRRVWEYSLVQAVEYAYSEFFPGGSFPIAFVFLHMQPELVDFNVHPAKKEARFKDLGTVHHRLVRTIREFLKSFHLRAATGGTADENAELDLGRTSTTAPSHSGSPEDSTVFRRARAGARTGTETVAQTPASQLGTPRRTADAPYELGRVFRPSESDTGGDDPGFRYIGQLFRLFLLAERGDRLYVVDQHAGHERILFDRLRNASQTQALLVPETFEPDDEQQEVLRQNAPALHSIGVGLAERQNGLWELSRVPASCTGNLGEVLETAASHPLPAEELELSFYAQVACKAAIKDGDVVDDLTARSLLKEIFALENARCPHGRPIWYELSRDRLFELVGRT